MKTQAINSCCHLTIPYNLLSYYPVLGNTSNLAYNVNHKNGKTYSACSFSSISQLSIQICLPRAACNYPPEPKPVFFSSHKQGEGTYQLQQHIHYHFIIIWIGLPVMFAFSPAACPRFKVACDKSGENNRRIQHLKSNDMAGGATGSMFMQFMISIRNNELPVCILKNLQTPFCIMRCCPLSHCFSPKQTFLKLNKQVSVICAALFLSMQALVSRLDHIQKSNLWGRGHFWQSQQQRSMNVWGKWCKSRCLEDRNYPVLRSFHKLEAVQVSVARESVWWSRDNPALMDSDSTRNPSGVKGLAVTLLFVKCSLFAFAW